MSRYPGMFTVFDSAIEHITLGEHHQRLGVVGSGRLALFDLVLQDKGMFRFSGDLFLDLFRSIQTDCL